MALWKALAAGVSSVLPGDGTVPPVGRPSVITRNTSTTFARPASSIIDMA